MRSHLAPLIYVDNTRLAEELEALHPHCFGWAMSCCDRHREDAEDVLHDVYVMVLDGRAKYEGRSAFRTWLFGVIRRTAASRRRRQRLHAVLGLRAERPASPRAADDAVQREDERHSIERALAQLSARQREVMQLVFYHELTLEEAATIMNVSIGSARTHYDRGKTRMAALLGGTRA